MRLNFNHFHVLAIHIAGVAFCSFLHGETTKAQATEDPPPIVSPEIHEDQHVTFRIEAPLADKVTLKGIQRVPINLKKGKHGIWSVTVGPLASGLYGYSFIVDGEATVDPENRDIKPERSPETSLLEVFTDPPLIYQWQDVVHGTVRLHDYKSSSLQRIRHLRVYTPPNFDQEKDKHYPVLYLFHGTGDTEATWTEFGRAQYIMDNLIAQKKIEPMLVVMTDGHADLTDEEGIDKMNLEEFEADMEKSAIPFIDQHYPTLADRDHRAICGLSMGGLQSIFIGLRHTDQFAWIGGMSAWLPHVEDYCKSALDDPGLNDKMRLLWVEIGKDDPYLPEFKKFQAVMSKHNVKLNYTITEGDHSWQVWRGYLADFATLLFR